MGKDIYMGSFDEYLGYFLTDCRNNALEELRHDKRYTELKLEKLPTMKSLQQEYATLSAEKKKCYSEYNQARKFMQDILSARQNVQQLLGYRDEEMDKDGDRTER
jgi:hypothetical protein